MGEAEYQLIVSNVDVGRQALLQGMVLAFMGNVRQVSLAWADLLEAGEGFF